MRQAELHFCNTVDLAEPELVKENNNAIRQEDRILRLFKIYKSGTPSEMLDLYNRLHPEIPLTSLRRGITNLKKEGKVYRSTEMKIGIYGKPEHYYKLI